MRVSDLTGDYIFVVDSQDVKALRERLAKSEQAFNSYFAEVGDGEYKTVYGMRGIVPLLDNRLTLCKQA